MRRILFAVTLAGFAAGPALAWEDGWLDENVPLDEHGYAYVSDDGFVALRGSLGVIGLQAKEYVFAGPGSENVASYLLWQGIAPLASAEFQLRLPQAFTLKAELRGAIGGDHGMEDYDWLAYAPSYDFNDWSHYSNSPNTNLDWYLDAALSLGQDIYDDETSRVNLNAGIKYTDVRWTARGGQGIYSNSAWRDTLVTFPDSPGITYRQQLPAVFAGIDIEIDDGNFVWGASAKGGYTFMAVATDDHWLRDLNYVDALQAAPMYTAKLSGGYRFSKEVSGFVEAGIEQVLLGRGDTTISGASSAFIPDAAGAEFANLSLSAGLNGRF